MTMERMAVRLRRVSDRSVWRGVEEMVDDRMKPTIAAETLVRSLSLFSSSWFKILSTPTYDSLSENPCLLSSNLSLAAILA